MNFLRKILLVAIAFVFVGNAEGAVVAALDLPDNTPGLQRKNRTFPIRLKVNGIRSIECLHIIVPDSAADKMLAATKGLNAKEQHESVITAKGNIYFPHNGVQPTTPEAVQYSCANVDAYNENSPVTKWYMKMFGVIPINQAAINTANIAGMQAPAPIYVQAGWSEAATNMKPIITYDFLFESINYLKYLGTINEWAEIYNTTPGNQAIPTVVWPPLNGIKLSDITEHDFRSLDQHALSSLYQYLSTKKAHIILTLNNCLRVAKGIDIDTGVYDRLLTLLRLMCKEMHSNEKVDNFIQRLCEDFTRGFNKVASSPVGRMLLYRILIEIRRHKNNNVGCLAKDIVPHLRSHVDNRNKYRSIIIQYGSKGCSYAGNSIFFNMDIELMTVIGDQIKNYNKIVKAKGSSDISIFHEMLHWYHIYIERQKEARSRK